jgi:hypothetical protein
MKVPLSQLAHTRSGDKGDTCNVGVIALREARNVKYGSFMEPGRQMTVTVEFMDGKARLPHHVTKLVDVLPGHLPFSFFVTFCAFCGKSKTRSLCMQ